MAAYSPVAVGTGFLNGRFTRFYIDVSGSNTGDPSWQLVGGELTGKWTIDPQLEDYTTKDANAIIYYPTRYKWNGSFDTNYLDDDVGQRMVRLVALTVGQATNSTDGALTAPGPICRIAWAISQDISGSTPQVHNLNYMSGLAAFKIDFDMTDAKMGKMTITLTGSGAISIAVDPRTNV
jgi:hypothetical protein